ncbi:hypothetical protein ASD00_12110 [Ensifer sp. Root31]|nr:hypothetical protein ASD00_12110 [Ensifer sp. Root31]
MWRRVQPCEIEARQGGHAILMNRLSRAVEHTGKPHPAEIALEPGAPHHARYAGAGEIERTDRRVLSTQRDRLRRVGLGRGRIDPGAADIVVDMAFDSVGGFIRKADIRFEIVGKREVAAILDAGETPKKRDTLGAQRLKAYRMHRAEHTARRDASRKSNDLLSPHVEKPAFEQPDHDVATPVAPREPPDTTGRKEDLSARFRQFLGDLSTRLAASDHQYRSIWQISSAAVAGSVDLMESRRQRGRPDRAHRAIQAAACDDNVVRPKRAV